MPIERLFQETAINGGPWVLTPRDESLPGGQPQASMTLAWSWDVTGLATEQATLRPGDLIRTRVVAISELNVADLKSNHVIYIGYVSGLGKLEEFVFASSELAVGERCGITIPTRYVYEQTGMEKMVKRLKVKRYYFEEQQQVEIPLVHQQRLRDVMGLEIGDGTAQVSKMIVARERVGRVAVQYAR